MCFGINCWISGLCEGILWVFFPVVVGPSHSGDSYVGHMIIIGQVRILWIQVRLWASWTHPQHSNVWNRARLLFRFCHNARHMIHLLWNNVKHLNQIKGWSDDISYPKGQLQYEIIMFSKKCPVHYWAPQLRRNILWTTKPHMIFHWHGSRSWFFRFGWTVPLMSS